MSRKWLVVVALVVIITPLTVGDDAEWKKAEAAFRSQDYAAARTHAVAAVKADPKNADAHFVHGAACLQLRDNTTAVTALTAAIQLQPTSWPAYDRRGDAYLKLGKFPEAIADFDKVLQLKPDFAPQHWRRGIALYYAGRYAEGVKQFETHKTANPQDVENAAWHFLCNAKVVGKEKARAGLIDVTRDRRVPMAEIQKLFAGKFSPADVVASAEKLPLGTEDGTEARFYAHLYVALWYAAEEKDSPMREHLIQAVEKYKISHYMWDVAAIHLAGLKPEKK